LVGDGARISLAMIVVRMDLTVGFSWPSGQSAPGIRLPGRRGRWKDFPACTRLCWV